MGLLTTTHYRLVLPASTTLSFSSRLGPMKKLASSPLALSFSFRRRSFKNASRSCRHREVTLPW